MDIWKCIFNNFFSQFNNRIMYFHLLSNLIKFLFMTLLNMIFIDGMVSINAHKIYLQVYKLTLRNTLLYTNKIFNRHINTSPFIYCHPIVIVSRRAFVRKISGTQTSRYTKNILSKICFSIYEIIYLEPNWLQFLH